MKRILFFISFIGIFFPSQAQVDREVLVVDLEHDISLPAGKAVKEIQIPRGWLKKNKRQLIQQCIDSTESLSGNCFKVTYYNDKEYYELKKGKDYYIKGVIYKLEEDEKLRISQEIESHAPVTPESTEGKGVLDFNDTSEVTYKANWVFQYGGESKLTLLPKFNLLRVHQRHLVKPYYGIELGVHPLFIAGAFTFSGILGVEINQFNLESSLSHFRTTKIPDTNGGSNGPYNRNLLNLKLGYGIKKFTLKLGTSFLIDETVPTGDETLPLLEIGKINRQIFGLELQYRMN